MKTVIFLIGLASIVLCLWLYERNSNTSADKDADTRRRQEENFIKSGINKMHISKSMRELMDGAVVDLRTQIYALVLVALGFLISLLVSRS